jgi:hypothetical protein
MWGTANCLVDLRSPSLRQSRAGVTVWGTATRRFCTRHEADQLLGSAVGDEAVNSAPREALNLGALVSPKERAHA